MYDKEDFFSPEQVDEQLDLSLLQRNSVPRGSQSGAADPNRLLVDDLRFLYSAEGAENARSLQRVWERIGEQRTGKQAAISSPTTPVEQPPLRLLKADRQSTPAPARQRKRRSAPNNVLAALAALLFLVIMVGSLFAIVHVMRQPQSNSNPAGSTATPQIGQWTPVAGYPYPTPGKTISVSPASTDGFSCLTFSLDGKQVAASTQGKVWIWDTRSNAQPFVYDPKAGSDPVVVAWSPVAPRLAVGSNLVQVIDPGNGTVIFTDPAMASDPGDSTARVTAVAWSPDGKRLAVAGQDPVIGNEVGIWDTEGNLLYTVPDQQTGDVITSLSWSSDGRYVAFANGQSVQAWDTHTPGGTPIFQHALTSATDVAWTPSGNNAGDLAFVSNSSTQVWNVWEGVQPVGTLVSSYPGTPNGALSWSPDGHYLATASGHNVIIYNAATGVHLYTYGGNTHDVHSLVWSPDGGSIASGERDSAAANHVRVWSA
jgi:WD40 repeat protein